MLQKIVSFTQQREKGGSSYPAANNLMSGWAFEKVGQQDEAQKWLQQWTDKEPQSARTKWTMNVYRGRQATLAADGRMDENNRILQQWITFTQSIKSWITISKNEA